MRVGSDTPQRRITGRVRLSLLLGAGLALILLIGGIYYMTNREQADGVYNGMGGTFKNTLADIDTPDPSIVFKDGYYYMTFTHHGADVMVMKSRTLNFHEAQRKVVWYPPIDTPYSQNIWAPEIQFIRGKWYIYFAADDGNNENHRMYALEAVTDDPLGEYAFKGQITDDTDKWAIDGLVMELDDELYFVWSGWEGDVNIQQNTYIAPMSDPLTISGPRVLIGEPDLEWERQGGPPYIHEGQAILQKDGRTFMAYSGAGSWTPHYSIGFLALEPGADPLQPASWTKLDGPFMTMSEEDEVFGPGHNTFVQSPDDTEIWNVYHATSGMLDGWSNRKARANVVEWDEQGIPVLGKPTALSAALPVPSGTGLLLGGDVSGDGEATVTSFNGIASAVDTDAVILLQYRNRSGDAVEAVLRNADSGEEAALLLPSTEDGSDGYAYGVIPLQAGHQSLEVRIGGADVDIVAIERTKAEAEDAEVAAGSEIRDNPVMSGGRSVVIAAGEERALAFNHLNVPRTGSYTLLLYATNVDGGGDLQVTVNGGKPQKATVPSGERGEASLMEVDVKLKPDGNTIAIGGATAPIELDRIEIRLAETGN